MKNIIKNIDMPALVKQLRVHEGLRLKIYTCSAGAKTIGIGRNLDARGFTNLELVTFFKEGWFSCDGIKEAGAYYLLENDIRLSVKELMVVCKLDLMRSVRQRVLVDMCVNLGITRLKGFKKMFAALDKLDFETASREMLASRWAKQVGSRALRLSTMMATGECAGSF